MLISCTYQVFSNVNVLVVLRVGEITLLFIFTFVFYQLLCTTATPFKRTLHITFFAFLQFYSFLLLFFASSEYFYR